MPTLNTVMKTEINDLDINQIIRLELNDPSRLAEIEEHHIEIGGDIYAYPATLLIKRQLSSYFFDNRYVQNNSGNSKLLQWMKLIYQLNTKFSKLEHRINRPQSHDTLKQEFTNWKQDFDTSFVLAEIHDQRLLHLSLLYRTQLDTALKKFIDAAHSTNDIGSIYAQHDISFHHSSLGRLIHQQLYACLNMAKKGAEYLSTHPLKNLFIQDPAIVTLTMAQDQLYEHAFGFQGIAKINPYQPYHQDFLRRFQLDHATKIEYSLPKQQLILVEYWVANFYNLALNTFKSSTFPLITCTQFLLFPYELSLMLLHVFSQIFIILPLRLWSLAQSQKLAVQLGNAHLFLSIYHHLQQYKNHLISKTWENSPELPQEAKTWLKSHLSYENLFYIIPNLLFKPRPKTKKINLPKFSFDELLTYLSLLPFKKEEQSLVIKTQTTHPVNQLKTAVDIIEDITFILEQDAILPFFRHHPFPASLNFLLSAATWISLNTALLAYSPLNQMLVTLENWVSSLGRVYMGKVISHDLISSMAACFLYWQLSLSGFQLSTNLLNQQDNLLWRNLSQSPDKICLGASALILLGYLEANLPWLPIKIDISQTLSLYNPLFAFINMVHHEARRCLNGLPPFNGFTLGVIGIKSSVFLYNLFKSNPELQLTQALSPIQIKQIHLHEFKLILLLNGLALKDSYTQAALRDKNLAKTYFLQLAQAFQTCPQKRAYQPFLQQFYRSYCQTRVFNLLRMVNIIFLPVHAIEWAYGSARKNLFHQYAGQTKVAEDLFILFQFFYAMIRPIFLCLRILNNYIILAAIRFPIFILTQLLPMGELKLKCMNVDDHLQQLFIHEQLIQGLRPLQVLHAKLAFHAGCYPDLSGQAELWLKEILQKNKKTQAHSLGFQIKT